jgi:PhoH-like ATPase
VDCTSEELAPHTCVILRTGEGTGTQSALGKVDAQGREIRPLEFYDQHELGIRPLNVQQKFALELLLDDEIKLVTLDGKAGTGKTLLALAAGLASINEDRYNRLLVSRPVIPMGREIGFLPGKLEEKLIPWMQPVFDNLDFLLDLLGRGRKKDQRLTRQKLMQNDILEIEALSFIRGRSLPRQYFIVDEAQNLTRHEVKTIISRAGRDTKIVLTGDQFQIDNPYVDTNSNGMQYVIEKFREVPLAGHITLVQGERSQLAELAADML